MHTKIIITLLIIANCCLSCWSRAALRRTPKVYNALITTDENLTSSRAYPVIQPTIHETGISHYPFGPYNPYGYYGPVVRFGQPIAPGLVTREQLPYPIPQAQFPPQLMPHPLQQSLQDQRPFEGYPAAQQPTAPPVKEVESTAASTQQAAEPAPTENQQPVVPPKDIPLQTQAATYMPMEENTPQEMPNEKLPIALNEYGLPPALIPLQQYTINRNGNPNPVNLPPYVFNQYPLLPGYYDPITGFRDQYLPPYEYSASPSQTYAVASALANRKKQVPIPQATIPAEVSLTSLADTAESTNTKTLRTEPEIDTDLIGIDDLSPNLESIKNNSKNKNSEVPDVPPPPIPSGAKTKPAS